MRAFAALAVVPLDFGPRPIWPQLLQIGLGGVAIVLLICVLVRTRRRNRALAQQQRDNQSREVR